VATFPAGVQLDLVHVPFTGAAPAVQATIGGHTPDRVHGVAVLAFAIQAGQVRAIGVAATERAGQIPDVPTSPTGIRDQMPNADRHR